MTDIRLALRRLATHPASTLASIAALAFAIAAAAVTWASIDAVLLHPLPLKDPDRLFIVGTSDGRGRFEDGSLYTRLPAVRASGAFEQSAAQWGNILPILGRINGTETTIRTAFATHDYFETLGIHPVSGRSFRPDEDTRGAAPVGMVTHRSWRDRFGSDPSLVGQSVELKGVRIPIIGILPPGFRGLDLAEPADLYLPFHTIAQLGAAANYFADTMPGYSPVSGTLIIVRLRPADGVAQAAARLASIESAADARAVTSRPSLLNISDAAVPESARAGMRNFAQLLAGTVALLVLIGSTTVGMLLLLRTDARSGEFAICVALGATRARLVGGVAAEGVLLALAGAALGIPVALWLFGVLETFLLPGNVSIASLELTLDRRLLAAISLVSLAAATLTAISGGLLGFRADLLQALRSSPGVTSAVGNRSRSLLVGLQSAVALALLAGAGLLARSLLAALSLNAGTDMRTIVSTTINLRPYGYSAERAHRYFEDVRRALQADPLLEHVSVSVSEGGMSAGGEIMVDGLPRRFPTTVSDLRVDDEYFDAMGMRVSEGRPFSPDDRPGGVPVAIVSASYGRLLGDGQSPIGMRIRATMSRPPNPPDEYEVVGVVSDVVTSVAALKPLVMYLPAAQGESGLSRTLTLRTSDPARAQRAIVTTAASVDPRVLPAPPVTLEGRILRQMSAQSFGATVLGTLGGIAMLLTLLGTYVLAESMAAMRLREMGIRAALGATQRQLGSILLVQTLRLVGVGLGGGLLLAWLGASTIRSFLFGVDASDPLTLGGIAVVILVLAVLVSLRAALRVARIDVAQVLRQGV
jgi:putative ABC transport system permease protein